MYIAIYCLAIFFVLLLYRLITKAERVQQRLHSSRIPSIFHVVFQYYFVFYLALLLGLFVPSLLDICQWEILYYQWLNPSRFTLPSHLTQEQRDALSIPVWLRVLSLASVLAVLLTVCVALLHTAQHVQVARQYNQQVARHIPYALNKQLTRSHDLALHVIALPVVYGIMSMRATSRVWMVMTGSGRGAHVSAVEYKARELVELNAYDSNYKIADLYEAWALWCFSKLCVEFVQARLKETSDVSTRIQGDQSTRHLLEVMLKDNESLSASLGSITMLGIHYFVGLYSLESIVNVVCFFLLVDWGIDTCHISSYACPSTWHPYLTGAGFIVSTIAISNIMNFEHSFKHHLKDFDPAWKFWGVKILVSIAFIQQAILSFVFEGFAKYSKIQVDLIYSSLISIELLPIALLHWKAWHPKGSWCRPESQAEQTLLALSERFGETVSSGLSPDSAQA